MRTAGWLVVVVVGAAGCAPTLPQGVGNNPFITPGAAIADGRPGTFAQNDSGDCFFLASLLALGQDEDGKRLLSSAIRPAPDGNGWLIGFPNLPGHAFSVSVEESNGYRLLASDGAGLSPPAWGDPDVGLLEIAADKYWKRYVKAEGVWDDVPMNALFMFSGAEQRLLWNRARATRETAADIDKFKYFAGNTVRERAITGNEEAETALRRIVAEDNDGLTLILLDYRNYHAAAIVAVDFDRRRYHTLETYLDGAREHALQELLDGLAGGYYALDYQETD